MVCRSSYCDFAQDLRLGGGRIALYIGTCGYHYSDWIGEVYPRGTPERGFLPLYSKMFNTVELDFTFYQVPSARQLEGMMRSAPQLIFSLKLYKEFTHDRRLDPKTLKTFLEAVWVLKREGRLGALLAQFPSSFRFGDDAIRWLKQIKIAFGEFRVAVEVRHICWLRVEAIRFLTELGFGFCTIDAPKIPSLIPPVPVVTSDFAYVRLHGRRSDKWWEHDKPHERYDYLYSEEEIKRVADMVALLSTKAKDVFVYFNNHYRGKAVKNAEMLKKALREVGT